MTARHDLEPAVHDWLHSTLDRIPDPSHRYPVVAIEVNDTPQQRGWLPPITSRRLHSMFSATKFIVAGVIVALFGGFLLNGVLTQRSDEPLPGVGAAATSDLTAEATLERDEASTAPESEPTTRSDILPGVDLVTVEREPGVFRVLGDTAGNDLVSVPPRRLVVAPDDSVWVGRGDIARNSTMTHLVELGQAGRIGLRGQGIGVFDAQNLAVDTEGRPWILGWGSSVQVWEDGDWAPVTWPNGSGRAAAIATTSDGSVWVARDVRDNPGPRVARIRDGQWDVLPTLERAGNYPVWVLDGLAPSPDGTVWLSCGWEVTDDSPCAGLLHFDGEAWSTIMPVDQQLRFPSPGWIAPGPDEMIWAYFGGRAERYLARLRDGSWTVYDESDGVPALMGNQEWVSSQAVDPKGTLWVAMSAESLYRPWMASASGLADPTDGVMSFDGTTWRQYLKGVTVDEVVATSDGSIWVLDRGGRARDVGGDLYVITPEAVGATE